MDVPSHVTSFIQKECVISVQHDNALLKFVFYIGSWFCNSLLFMFLLLCFYKSWSIVVAVVQLTYQSLPTEKSTFQMVGYQQKKHNITHWLKKPQRVHFFFKNHYTLWFRHVINISNIYSSARFEPSRLWMRNANAGSSNFPL